MVEPKEIPREIPARSPVAGRGTGGRQRLIDAALELASTTRSLASLGLREVTRYAGLAPNSFYRHFKDFDDLGLAAVEMLGSELRRGLRERRRRLSQNLKAKTLVTADTQVSKGGREIINATVGLVLDFVIEHPTAYIVGIRELNGSSPTMRKAVNQLLDAFAADMAEDVQAMVHFPGLEPETLQEISRQVIRQMTFFSMDYLENPARRDQIREQAERFIIRLFVGELAMMGKATTAQKTAARPTRPR